MSEFIPQPNCADPNSETILSVEQAKAEIDALLSPVSGWRKVPVRDSLGQVIHQPVISAIQVPPQNNSAMDGYAIHSEDIEAESFSLTNVGRAMAGQPYTGTVARGECVRIMTGAVMPPECDTVVMQEHVQVEGEKITIYQQQKPGQNVRMAGEDIEIGAEVLSEGRRVLPSDLGLIASLGIGEVIVKRKLRVAFFSTGDELRSIGESLELGQIYDSNRYTLYAMLKRLDVDILDMGVVIDDREALKQTLLQASAQADVIITSGGVSVGEADYIKEILAEIGSVNFWKIAMKPGRPVAYGKIDRAVFFGLPGNPVSVMVTFYQFVQSAIRKMAGETNVETFTLKAICQSKMRKRPGRFEFQRGIMYQGDDGQMHVKTTGTQGSGVLHSMSIANCFILLESECDGITPGQQVTVQPFSGLV